MYADLDTPATSPAGQQARKVAGEQIDAWLSFILQRGRHPSWSDDTGQAGRGHWDLSRRLERWKDLPGARISSRCTDGRWRDHLAASPYLWAATAGLLLLLAVAAALGLTAESAWMSTWLRGSVATAARQASQMASTYGLLLTLLTATLMFAQRVLHVSIECASGSGPSDTVTATIVTETLNLQLTREAFHDCMVLNQTAVDEFVQSNGIAAQHDFFRAGAHVERQAHLRGFAMRTRWTGGLALLLYGATVAGLAGLWWGGIVAAKWLDVGSADFLMGVGIALIPAAVAVMIGFLLSLLLLWFWFIKGGLLASESHLVALLDNGRKLYLGRCSRRHAVPVMGALCQLVASASAPRT